MELGSVLFTQTKKYRVEVEPLEEDTFELINILFIFLSKNNKFAKHLERTELWLERHPSRDINKFLINSCYSNYARNDS